MMKPLSFEVLLTEIGEPKADFERVYPYKDIVFWSFIRKEHQKTNWWAKDRKAKGKGSTDHPNSQYCKKNC